jgi:hypothetical protein
VAGEARCYGNASWPDLISHITLVSVMTEANVPIRTATEAGSIQVSNCRAITKAFSAGGRDASSTAVTAHSEQRYRRRGVLQECQRVHDRDRKLEMQRCRERTGASRHDQRIEHDLPGHDSERMQ